MAVGVRKGKVGRGRWWAMGEERALDCPPGEEHVIFTFEKMFKNFSRQVVV